MARSLFYLLRANRSPNILVAPIEFYIRINHDRRTSLFNFSTNSRVKINQPNFTALWKRINIQTDLLSVIHAIRSSARSDSPFPRFELVECADVLEEVIS
jgi:hypothetical protein